MMLGITATDPTAHTPHSVPSAAHAIEIHPITSGHTGGLSANSIWLGSKLLGGYWLIVQAPEDVPCVQMFGEGRSEYRRISRRMRARICSGIYARIYAAAVAA
jgi:hypothetical protein